MAWPPGASRPGLSCPQRQLERWSGDPRLEVPRFFGRGWRIGRAKVHDQGGCAGTLGRSARPNRLRCGRCPVGDSTLHLHVPNTPHQV